MESKQPAVALRPLGIMTARHRVSGRVQNMNDSSPEPLIRNLLFDIQTETALHIQRQAMEASINGIVIADMRAPDRPLIYVNPAFEAISGYKAEEILGKNCRFMQGSNPDSESNLMARQKMRDALSRCVSCSVVLHNFRRDGRPFWNELFMAPIFDADGVMPTVSAFKTTSRPGLRRRGRFRKRMMNWNGASLRAPRPCGCRSSFCETSSIPTRT